MHLGDSEQGRERGRTPRRRGGDNLISGKKKFVHVEVGTLFTFLFWKEGVGVVGEGKEGGSMQRKRVYRRVGEKGRFLQRLKRV